MMKVVIFCNSSVHAVLTDVLNKFVVIAIIDVYSNENRPRGIKRLFEYEVSAGV
jgi:hypothetical protein